MAVFKQKVLCWTLASATFAGLIYIMITVVFAVVLRTVDLIAIGSPDIEISRGFHTQWRSHQAEAFLASDIIVFIGHMITLIFTFILLIYVSREHFVMYMDTLKYYRRWLMVYTFFEFCFSVFEFSFYGNNTFRLEFLVFIWLYWLFRVAVNILFILVIQSREEEMKDEMAMELRFSEKKYSHSYA
ncbi:hypothetical protein LOTGIDRAFT_234536 [Lottia gigantea]|uniref:Uncharacterized protein n=1 Tax=Lottia gigantea TaxID=225164 RepID=V3ZBT2_LOTGI|nr:hypothetical protein LOTGIDRAFT_234536 [Lottia gigantea]ESO88488.1 hypothetical protein LOTGIDRAFT_234536 [Lottia gigantea]